jgi:Fe2+ transport system protein FeoA
MDSCLPSADTVLYARQLDIETQSQDRLWNRQLLQGGRIEIRPDPLGSTMKRFSLPLTTTGQVVPLDHLAPGESGTILEVDGQPDHVHRLSEMGLRPGRPVRMVRSGGACIVAVGNHRFGFRGADAALILVEVGKPAPARQ